MASPRLASTAEALSVSQVTSVSTEIDMPTLAVTKGLLAIWEESIGLDGELPPFSAFAPEKLSSLAPFAYALERTDFDDEFRVRYMGDAIIQSIGENFTGLTTADYSDHPSAWRVDIYRKVLARGAPMFTAVSLGDFDRANVKTECALLPVIDEAGALNMVVCAAAPYTEVA